MFIYMSDSVQVSEKILLFVHTPSDSMWVEAMQSEMNVLIKNKHMGSNSTT